MKSLQNILRFFLICAASVHQINVMSSVTQLEQPTKEVVECHACMACEAFSEGLGFDAQALDQRKIRLSGQFGKSITPENKAFLWGVYEESRLVAGAFLKEIEGLDGIALKYIYTDTKSQGKGFGKKLLQALTQHYQIVHLCVETDKKAACGLYTKCGFQEITGDHKECILTLLLEGFPKTKEYSVYTYKNVLS